MRKTLLITAAALAAGIISTQAQVYSQNIVGYVNVTVPANGYQLIGHQLDIGDGTNGISTVFSTGLNSDPNGSTNSQILLWNFAVQQYQTLYYFTAADATADFFTTETQTGWYDQGGNFYNTPLPPGDSAFIYNPGNPGALTVTMTGTVPQATNVYTIQPGYNLVDLTDPVVTNLVGGAGSGGFTGTSDPNGVNNDQLLTWQTGVQQYQTLYYFTAADATANFFTTETQTGFYDQGGNFYPEALPVGAGFFINHVVAGTEYWTNSFSF